MTSKIKVDSTPSNLILISNCSSFSNLYDTLKDANYAVGGGNIGNAEATALRGILPNPSGFGNYTEVFIEIKSYELMKAVAISLFSAKVAECYIYNDRNGWKRTGWVTRT